MDRVLQNARWSCHNVLLSFSDEKSRPMLQRTPSLDTKKEAKHSVVLVRGYRYSTEPGNGEPGCPLASSLSRRERIDVRVGKTIRSPETKDLFDVVMFR
jgi:hypothetical protein